MLTLDHVERTEVYLLEIDGVRVPMSSFQATMRRTGKSFLQAVIPSGDTVLPGLVYGAIMQVRLGYYDPGTDQFSDLEVIAETPLEQIRSDEGPTRYTLTLSGYGVFPNLGTNNDARSLSGIQTRSINQGIRRVRCDVDLLLRPDGTAIDSDGLQFTVDMIQYFVNATSAAMEVMEVDSQTDQSPDPDFYFTDFSEYTVGEIPSDWEQRWAGEGGPARWVVEENDGEFCLFANSLVNQDRQAIVWTALPTVADCQILVDFEFNLDSDTRFALRLSGSQSSTTGLTHGHRCSTHEDRLTGYNQGAYFSITDPFIVRSVAVRHLARISVSGNNHKMSIWEKGTPEPSGWMYDFIDSTVSSPGETGIFSFMQSSYRIYSFAFSADPNFTIPVP